MKYLKIYFLFASVVFRRLSNDVALKGLFLYHCVVFSLFCVVIVISEPFFLRGLILGLILLLSEGRSLRLDMFDLKRNWNKLNSFLNSIR